jgi:trk system potassium uptake protein TrkH
VVRFTFIIEGLGTVLFCFRFLPDNGLLDGLFLSVFNAVSAFCNAGLTPFSDSFMSFRTDWMINWGLCFLIISGGIGFPVLSELKRQFPFNRRRWRSMSLHTRLILSTTAALLLAGTLLILFMEQGNTLASLPPRERFLAAFFQSVTARTAGFNTLPISQMANETLFVLITLMFIGASSGSCGGGIKTGTFMTLVVMGFSRLRGYEQPQIFQRSISVATVGRAISVVMMSLLVVILGTWLILMTELGDLPHSLSRGKFLELFFEVISAFGTVGLSMGITAVLSTAGKLLITLIMFVGRLGPLVVAIAVSRRKVIPYRYAEESIMVG